MGRIAYLDFMRQPLAAGLKQVSSRFDPEYGVLWLLMNPSGIPCFSQDFVSELLHYNRTVESYDGEIFSEGKMHPLHFSVLRSQVPGVFNLGGDLALFSHLIRTQNREALMHYATICIDTLMSRINHYNQPVITLSLVEGDALGAGLETALSSDIIIAERRSRMGFPEIMFNLAPGHGAYSLVARKTSAAVAEKMILGGKIYTADELHALGLVDMVVDNGKGEGAVYEYCRKMSRSANGFLALQKMRQRFNPVTHAEMMDITTYWVDAAMQLGERDLKVMDRLVRSQQKQYGAKEQLAASRLD